MDFKTRLAKLIDVKTVVTFCVTGVFAYLSVTEKIDVQQFMIIAVMVFTYFFAKKENKDVGGEG